MDLLAYLASIERRADAVIDNAAALKAEVEQARTLYHRTKEPVTKSGDYPLQCGNCQSVTFLDPLGSGCFAAPPQGWKYDLANGWRCPGCPR